LSDNRLIEIGRRLRVARLDVGASLRDAGLRVGRSRQTVTNWEDGAVEVGILHFTDLADFYGVSVEYLIYGRENFPGAADFSDSAAEQMAAAFKKAMKGA